MSNEEKLVNAFVETLEIDRGIVVDTLERNSIKEWDSVAHMQLVAALEEAFDRVEERYLARKANGRGEK